MRKICKYCDYYISSVGLLQIGYCELHKKYVKPYYRCKDFKNTPTSKINIDELIKDLMEF